jgi:hypothetical protein
VRIVIELEEWAVDAWSDRCDLPALIREVCERAGADATDRTHDLAEWQRIFAARSHTSDPTMGAPPVVLATYRVEEGESEVPVRAAVGDVAAFGSDTWHRIGHRLTCPQADTFAAMLTAAGYSEAADEFLTAHRSYGHAGTRGAHDGT